MDTSTFSLTEAQIRQGFFPGMPVITATREALWPGTKLLFSPVARWPLNIAMTKNSQARIMQVPSLSQIKMII
jgi:hypothetical protein